MLELELAKTDGPNRCGLTFVHSPVFKNQFFNELQSLAFGCLLEVAQEGVVGKEELIAAVNSSCLLVSPDSAVAVVPVPVLIAQFFLRILSLAKKRLDCRIGVFVADLKQRERLID